MTVFITGMTGCNLFWWAWWLVGGWWAITDTFVGHLLLMIRYYSDGDLVVYSTLLVVNRSDTVATGYGDSTGDVVVVLYCRQLLHCNWYMRYSGYDLPTNALHLIGLRHKCVIPSAGLRSTPVLITAGYLHLRCYCGTLQYGCYVVGYFIILRWLLGTCGDFWILICRCSLFPLGILTILLDDSVITWMFTGYRYVHSSLLTRFDLFIFYRQLWCYGYMP